MITDKKYFSDRLEIVNSLVYEYDKEVMFLKKSNIYDFTRKHIHELYSGHFLSFPYVVESSSDTIGISIYPIELLNAYHDFEPDKDKLDREAISNIKKHFKLTQIDTEYRYCINDFLDEFFHNIIYEYQKFISNAKGFHFFSNIDDERIILSNLLKLYSNILNDETKQLCIFWGVSLTKEIADKVTEMLVDFIQQRLIVLNSGNALGNINSKTSFIDSKRKTINWLGTQQELCELFIELIEKKWVPEIEEGTRSQFTAAILSLFDVTGTKRNKSSNHKNSFYQQFKGEVIDEIRYYSFLENDKYTRRFSKIIENKKK